MKTKIIGIFICMLLLLTILPTGEAVPDDVTIKISAGKFGLSIGRGVKFKVVNKGDDNKNFTENLVYDYYFRDSMDSNRTENYTVHSHGTHVGRRFPAFGLIRVYISIEMEGVKVEREGICIGQIVFFNK